MAATPSKAIPIVAQLERIRVTFDGYASFALADMSLDVRRGEIIGLIGPEGCGKSTALLILAGRLPPSDGKVRVFGRPPRRASVRARIGYLPQNPRRPNGPGLFRLLQQRLGKLARNEEKLESVVPNNLHVARLLLKNPDLMVLDSPFTGLDTAAKREMKERICDMARHGKTVILGDRLLSPAMDVCNRMAIMFRGQIQAIGSLGELLSVPDAIRILGPVLPPASAERVLTTIREEMPGHSNFPKQRAEDGGMIKLPNPQVRSPDSQSRASHVLAALMRPSPNATMAAPPAEPIDTVNQQMLDRLTKPTPPR